MRNQFVGLHLDFVGFSASMLCAVHCAALPFAFSLLPMTGLHFLQDPWIEYTIILISFFIASYSLASGYRKHHRRLLSLVIVSGGFVLIALSRVFHREWLEMLLTSGGGLMIAVAHFVNWRHIRQSQPDFDTCTNDPN